jgi:hypothetical protein
MVINFNFLSFPLRYSLNLFFFFFALLFQRNWVDETAELFIMDVGWTGRVGRAFHNLNCVITLNNSIKFHSDLIYCCGLNFCRLWKNFNSWGTDTWIKFDTDLWFYVWETKSEKPDVVHEWKYLKSCQETQENLAESRWNMFRVGIFKF